MQKDIVEKSRNSLQHVDAKFGISKTVNTLQGLMERVTADKVTPETVNAACNCVSQLTGLMDITIKACRFLNDSKNNNQEN